MEEILKNLAENFKKLSEALPKQLESMQLSKEDALKVKDAIKKSGFNKALKDLEKVKAKLNNFR